MCIRDSSTTLEQAKTLIKEKGYLHLHLKEDEKYPTLLTNFCALVTRETKDGILVIKTRFPQIETDQLLTELGYKNIKYPAYPEDKTGIQFGSEADVIWRIKRSKK